jgi:hypothetical protein
MLVVDFVISAWIAGGGCTMMIVGNAVQDGFGMDL